jgi:hypothetical protein
MKRSMYTSREELIAGGADPAKVDRVLAKFGAVLPRLAGGSPEPDSPVMYPLDPVSVSSTLITLDQYVENPTVITRTIADLSEQHMYAHKIFSPGPGVTGGAILFERPNPLLVDLYAERRTQQVAPGAEFPINRFLRGVPMVSTPRKIGDKFQATKEDKKRNNPNLIIRAIQQNANTLTRDIEIMALSELSAVISAESRTFAGNSWSAQLGKTMLETTHSGNPLADYIGAKTAISLEERGHVLNGQVINPHDMNNLITYYGADDVDAALKSVGIEETNVTPRQARGKVKLYEQGGVGDWSNEFPLEEDEWEEKKTQSWWYQWSVSPAFAVTDQFAMLEITGVE